MPRPTKSRRIRSTSAKPRRPKDAVRSAKAPAATKKASTPRPTPRRTHAAKGRAAAPRPASEVETVLARLYEQHPNAFTELNFRTPFELLVATILSAQSTDRGVNAATPALFARYPDARTLAAATPAELEPLVKTTGFFRTKARAIHGMATALVERHGGEVPADMAALTALPGVGRKTANVVLGHALGVPGLPVDRHVLRVANRLKLVQAATPEEAETQLCAVIPSDRWTLSSDTLILHGRRICRPRPLCDRCAVNAMCPFAALMAAAPARATAPSRRSEKSRR